MYRRIFVLRLVFYMLKVRPFGDKKYFKWMITWNILTEKNCANIIFIYNTYI